jgi:hypothetical protein
MDKSSLAVRVLNRISERQFIEEHLRPEVPALLSGVCAEWEACHLWTPEYFRSLAPDLRIPIKSYRADSIDVSYWTLSDYSEFLINSAAKSHGEAASGDTAPYCHDIPIFAMVESLVEDCNPFPRQLLPSWYRKRWWRYAQFFLGPRNSLTPLHFDTLLTHNIFFQIRGRKRFILLPADQTVFCGRRDWRWFDIDPEKPDLRKFPGYRQATPIEVIVKPGDILYIPPGTLHHVRSLETSVSFNIDFHTKRSALRALAAGLRGMPIKSLYYNLLIALGVIGGVPDSIIFKFYRPYLSYVS